MVHPTSSIAFYYKMENKTTICTKLFYRWPCSTVPWMLMSGVQIRAGVCTTTSKLRWCWTKPLVVGNCGYVCSYIPSKDFTILAGTEELVVRLKNTLRPGSAHTVQISHPCSLSKARCLFSVGAFEPTQEKQQLPSLQVNRELWDGLDHLWQMAIEGWVFIPRLSSLFVQCSCY